MRTTQSRVSIITLNYKQPIITCEFLSSMSKITYKNYEIILINNGSPEKDLQYITNRFPGINVIHSPNNLGFAGGNNLGLQKATGEYILFINNDTVVAPDFLEPLVDCIKTEQNAGIVCPKIMFYDQPNRIQFLGFTNLHPITLRNKCINYEEEDNTQRQIKPIQTFFPHGAAMLTSKQIIGEVGHMDEIFFLYYEEMDWGKRIRNAGYKIIIQPNSIVYHKDSGTIGKESPMKTYYLNRNRLLYARRNSVFFLLPLIYIYFILIVTPKDTLKYILKGKIQHALMVNKALFWNFKLNATK